MAAELDVPQHVLRFWETKFSQVRPVKRGGGRRYYRPEDVDLLRRIRNLLYTEGYTIRGVQRLLRDGTGRNGAEGHDEDPEEAPATTGAATGAATQAAPAAPAALPADKRAALNELLGELQALRSLIDEPY
ncbi:MAG: MerR family transcriptional regulator [Acetobacterales bacterium]